MNVRLGDGLAKAAGWRRMGLARTPQMQPPIASRRMALLPGLPVLVKAAAIVQKAKMGSSFGSVIASRMSGARSSWWGLQMRRVTYGSAAATAVGSGVVYGTSQEEIAISGRKRLLLTTREEEIAYADEASAEILAEFAGKCVLVRDLEGKPPPPPLFGYLPYTSKARRNQGLIEVAERLVRATLSSNDLPPGVEKLQWRLHLIEDDETMNAFVLPNGHIYVFTGVLQATPSLDVLAFLVAHECAHAVLRHGGEALSKAPLLELAGLLATSALASILPIAEGGYTLFQMAMLRVGLSAVQAPTYLLDLSHSRDHESEADEVGVLLASRACFDPYHAQYLFHNFAQMKRDAGHEEGDSALFSTHPLDKVREEAVRTRVREGMGERAKCGCAPVDFRQRRTLDRKLKRDVENIQLRRLSCSARGHGGCDRGAGGQGGNKDAVRVGDAEHRGHTRHGSTTDSGSTRDEHKR